MSILSRMGAAVGVGAAEVTVTLEKGAYTWNEAVRGTARITGGSVEQTASELRVFVEEHWTTYDSEDGTEHHTRAHGEIVAATGLTVTPGAAQEVTFEVTVPQGADPSSDWSIVARFCVPRAADREGKAGFQLELPPFFQQVEGALTAVAPFQRRNQVLRGAAADMDFAPPAELKRTLDGVRLVLHPEGTGLAGTLEINPQERSLGDVLKSLAKLDRVKHPVQFSAEDLAGGGAADKLRALLQPYLQ